MELTKRCGLVQRWLHRWCRRWDVRVAGAAIVRRSPEPRYQAILWNAYIREQDHWWCACANRVGTPPEPIDAMVIRALRGRVG